MKYLDGPEEKEAKNFLDIASQVAEFSSCYRSSCGSIIVKDKEVIGSGYNSPPLNKLIDYCLKDDLPVDFKSDKTCCIHAEQRAINDALSHYPEKIIGSRLYFIRLDEERKQQIAGKPYCTMCSKMTLDVGISEFVLLHKKGIAVYNTEEYNELSFQSTK